MNFLYFLIFVPKHGEKKLSCSNCNKSFIYKAMSLHSHLPMSHHVSVRSSLSTFLINLLPLSSSNRAHMLTWTKFNFGLFLRITFFLSYCTTLIQDILSMEKKGLLVATVTKLSSMRPVQESTEPKENVVSTLKNTLMSANCVARTLDTNPS